MTSADIGEIITFYSYKGGTGRSMALSNIACLLTGAERQSDEDEVLMIDWDLEAPGLHRFFYDTLQGKFASAENSSRTLDEHPGLIDLFLELDAVTPPDGYASDEEAEAMAEATVGSVQLDRFIVQTNVPNLSLLKAGSFDERYSQRVNMFDWEGLYNRSPWLINAFAERLATRFRYVLVDSRTGHTDISGICTMLMPQKLVVVFTPNRQSLTGLLTLVRKATKYRRESDDLRPLLIYPLPSRIEASREDLRADWRLGNDKRNISGYEPLFAEIFREVYDLEKCNLDHYFDEVQIQQSPDYAYGEEIAVLIDQQHDRLSMATSYRAFTRWLITTTAPWTTPPSLIESNAKLEHDKIFTDYLDWLQRLLSREPLRELASVDIKRIQTRARTLAVLKEVDRERKRDLMRFLHESALIKKEDPNGQYQYPVIGLQDADLREADLEYINLSGDALPNVNAENATLRGANLSYTDLSHINLVRADLTQADLSSAYLRGALLRNAVLENALLVKANLHNADLTQADLSGANLTGALVTDQQLNACASIAGAILPAELRSRLATKRMWLIVGSILGVIVILIFWFLWTYSY